MLLEQRVSPVFDVLVVLHSGRIGTDAGERDDDRRREA
jgi:hypothetical protein